MDMGMYGLVDRETGYDGMTELGFTHAFLRCTLPSLHLHGACFSKCCLVSSHLGTRVRTFRGSLSALLSKHHVPASCPPCPIKTAGSCSSLVPWSNWSPSRHIHGCGLSILRSIAMLVTFGVLVILALGCGGQGALGIFLEHFLGDINQECGAILLFHQ